MRTVLMIVGIWFAVSVVLGLFIARVIALGSRAVIVAAGASSVAALIAAGCGGVRCSTEAVNQHEWTVDHPAPVNLPDRVRAAEQQPTHRSPITVCHGVAR